MTEPKIRLFIALDLPEVNEQNEPIGYAEVQLYLKNTFVNFRPTPKVHVTLVFIGSIAQNLLGTVKHAIHSAVAAFIEQEKEGLVNGISGLMIAPGAEILGKNAIALRLLDSHLLLRLILYLQNSLKNAGIDFDIPKHEQLAHVTLGRIALETVDELQLKRVLCQLQAPLGARANAQEAFTANTITLYQSLPGSEYIPLLTLSI